MRCGQSGTSLPDHISSNPTILTLAVPESTVNVLIAVDTTLRNRIDVVRAKAPRGLRAAFQGLCEQRGTRTEKYGYRQWEQMTYVCQGASARDDTHLGGVVQSHTASAV